MTSRFAFIGLALLASASFDASAQITLAPLADAYVRDGSNAAKNFGKATTLQVSSAAKAGNNYDTYFKFDMTAVPAFVQAKLRLYAGLSASGSVTATLYGVPVTTWSETGLIWNNKPARGAALSVVTVKNKSSAWIEIDLTSFLLSERAQGRKVVSMALHSAANASVILKVNSKEASKNTPQLVFTADKAPSATLTAPAANSVFAAPASINLAANVSDPDGTITKVDFFQGTTLLGTVSRAPYAFTWTAVAAGRYSLTAKATDNSGVTTTSSAISVVVDALPSVSLTVPADQSSFRAPASFNLSATASDSDGSISKVEFYQGSSLLRTVTQAPYSVAINQSTPGVYSYSAKATDNNGLAAQSSSISVTVLADVAPAIALTAPADGSQYRIPASITLSANASDPDGSIARVDFYQGGSLVGTAAQAPYSITIEQSTPGVYVFLAKAIDDSGVTAQSNSVSVTVSALPAMYYIQTDQIDTPRVVTDQANKVVWRWDAADPFGASAPDEDPDGDGARFTLNLRFPGQYFDRETGLHYNYYRDYDPAIGRYIESDPTGLQGGINTYAYVTGNPLLYIDPFGLDVGAPGLAESFVPVWGSGREAINDFQTGHYVWGTVNGVMAASDVALVGYGVKALCKGAWKMGSHTWSATRKWYGKTRGLPPNTQVHHWVIPQGGWGKAVPGVVKNQPWNLNPMRDWATHANIHGNGPDPYNAVGKWWHGTPDWAKIAEGSIAGKTGNAFRDDDCECDQ